MIDVERTIISQYANSPILRGLIETMNDCISPDADIQKFYDDVFNIDTAQGFGLDLWGEIIGVSRTLKVPAPIGEFLGFSEGAGYFPFGQRPFYVDASTQSFGLSDDAYRTLLLVKAAANISDSTAQSINALLQNLFAGRGVCYVSDLGAMQLRYTFSFPLLPYEKAILSQSGILPCPAGVMDYIFNPPTMPFGFSEAGAGVYPFGQGTFLGEGAIYAAY